MTLDLRVDSKLTDFASEVKLLVFSELGGRGWNGPESSPDSIVKNPQPRFHRQPAISCSCDQNDYFPDRLMYPRKKNIAHKKGIDLRMYNTLKQIPGEKNDLSCLMVET